MDREGISRRYAKAIYDIAESSEKVGEIREVLNILTENLEEEEEFKPIFTKKNQPYVPFDKVIVGMSMDELQPLGKKQDVNDVRIYEFLSVLSESILYHREKAKANERK